MQINLDPTREDLGDWFAYEVAPGLELRICKLTPPVDGECMKKATSRPTQVNGRFRRQLPTPEFDAILYQREIFLACVTDWRFLPGVPCPLTDEHGAPLVYSEEHKRIVALQAKGLVTFGYEIANDLGDISAEQVRVERESFRRTDQILPGVAGSELRDVSDPL